MACTKTLVDSHVMRNITLFRCVVLSFDDRAPLNSCRCCQSRITSTDYQIKSTHEPDEPEKIPEKILLTRHPCTGIKAINIRGTVFN